MSESTIHKPPLPKTLMAALLLITFIIFLLGLQVLDRQKQGLLINRQTELTAIAELKADQVTRWRSGLINDGQLIQEDLTRIDLVNSFLSDKTNTGRRDLLTSWMKSQIKHKDYRSIVLLDTNWEPVIAIPVSEGPEGATKKYGQEKIQNDKEVVLTELHRAQNVNYVHFDLLIPLYKDSGSESSFIAMLLIRIDPTIILYPTLERWPTPSATGEAFLTREPNGTIIYISNLRFHPGALLKTRTELTDNTLPSSVNKSFDRGVKQILDYRDKQVLLASKEIPGTEWSIQAKIDIEEIFRSSQKEIILTKIVLALILISVLSIGSFLIRFQLVRYYKKMFEAETEKQALIKHFNYILKFANDLIFLFDESLTIVEVNDKVIDTYGYSKKDLIGMKLERLRGLSAISEISVQYDDLRHKKSLTFDTIHRKKDGKEFQVEVSARVVEIEGKTFYQNICRDVTERKRQKQNLNNLVQKYNLALSASDMGVWEWDFTDNKLVWDDTVTRIFGKDKDKITDSPNEWVTSLHPEDKDKARAEVRTAAAGLSDYNSEYRIILPDGAVKFVRSTGRMLRDINNKPVRMTGVTLDITDQRKAFDLLKERDFWLSESQRAGQIGFFSMDIKADIWATSEVLDDILGLEKGAPKTLKTWEEIIHRDHFDEIKKYFYESATPGNKRFDKEYKIIKHDTGEERWILCRGEFAWSSEDAPDSLIGTMQDITERKKVDEELRISNKKINTIINNLKGVIFRCRNDKDWTIKYISDGIFELTGYYPEDFIDNNVRSFNSVIFAPDRARVWEDIQESLKRDSAYTIEYRVTTTSGSLKWVWERGRASVNDSGEVKFIEGFITDITDRKHVEEELIRAKEKAEESDRLKTAFLHNVSHEIRTPMNAIVGFTTLLDSPELDKESRRQYMDVIFQSSNQLLSIITDIVDISNIEVGHVKLSIGSVNINTLVKNLYDQFSLRADQQGIKLTFRNALSDDASFVSTDGTKLIQVITNLVNNAFKFTPKGEIEFGYTLRSNDIEFYVKDTGIGIEADNFDRIFNRFFQVENSLTKQYSGTGLGLAISKAYVELMGGRIWLTSKKGKGTTFYFTIPHDDPGKPKVLGNTFNRNKMSIANGKTILVAEDDRINFLLIREILAKTGINILWAANGEEAVEICHKNSNVDLILMDIKMPIMDGYEALRLIKGFKPDLPVVAITAYAQESDKEKSLAEGCAAHITKPIDRTQLFGVLQKYL